jgi:hypothetical protein
MPGTRQQSCLVDGAREGDTLRYLTHGAVCPGQNDEMMNQGNLPGQRRGRTRAMGDELAHILCRVRYHDATHLLAACSRQAERYCTVLYVVSIFLSSAHGSFSLSLGMGHGQCDVM